MLVQKSTTHCYFVLGMLFEKVKHSPLLHELSSTVYLSQAYFLLSKIHKQPSLESVWHFLLKKPISLKKEEKKLELLFRLVHILRKPPKSTYEILEFFTQWDSSTKKEFCTIKCHKDELQEITSLEDLDVFLQNITAYIHFDSEVEDFIKASCTSILLQKIQIMRYPLLRLSFAAGENDFWDTLDLGMRKSIEMLELLSVLEQDIERKTPLLGRHATSAQKVLDCMYKNPVIQLRQIQLALTIAKPNAIAFIDKAVDVGILQKLTLQKRNNIYSNPGIMHIFFNFS